MGCDPDYDCIWIVDCDVRYYRPVDRKEYRRHNFGFAIGGTSPCEVLDLTALVTTESRPESDGRWLTKITWNNERYESAFACYLPLWRRQTQIEDLAAQLEPTANDLLLHPAYKP